MLQGGRQKASKAEQEHDARVVHQHFLSMTGPLLEATLAEFQYSQHREDRKAAAHELVAYFDWCQRENIEDAPEGALLDSYILRFARIVVSRMSRGEKAQSSLLDGDYVIPTWTAPNVVFGWDRPDHRPRKDTFLRNLAIFSFRKRLMDRGVSAPDATQRTSVKFGLAQSTIEKIYRETKCDGAFQEQLRRFSDQEVSDLVEEFTELGRQ